MADKTRDELQMHLVDLYRETFMAANIIEMAKRHRLEGIEWDIARAADIANKGIESIEGDNLDEMQELMNSMRGNLEGAQVAIVEYRSRIDPKRNVMLRLMFDGAINRIRTMLERSK